MTDNGGCYIGREVRRVVQQHRLRHLRTRPYAPRTNGKAEALVGILLRDWAYAYIWHSSAARARATRLPPLAQHPPSPRLPQRPTHHPHLTGSEVLHIGAGTSPPRVGYSETPILDGDLVSEPVGAVEFDALGGRCRGDT